MVFLSQYGLVSTFPIPGQYIYHTAICDLQMAFRGTLKPISILKYIRYHVPHDMCLDYKNV